MAIGEPRAGCSKRPDVSPAQPWRAKTRLVPNKAADESKPEAYPLGYVEDFDESRTKLADFFSSLLRIEDCRMDRMADQFLSTLQALKFNEKVESGDFASQLTNE